MPQFKRLVAVSMLGIAGAAFALAVARRHSAARGSGPPPGALSVVFTHGQELEKGPCGCALRDLGGIDRQKALYASWRRAAADRQWLFVSSGPSFSPSFESPTPPSEYVDKATALVDAWNDAGLSLLAVSARDFSLSHAALRRLERRSRFPWLSTNLAAAADGTPLFRLSLVRPLGTGQAAFLAVTSRSHVPPPGITVLDPAEAVRTAVAALAPPPAFVVIVADALTAEERERVHDAIPRPHLLLWGSPDEQSYGALLQRDGYSLALRSLDGGKSLARFDLESPPGEGSRLHNPPLARTAYEMSLAVETEVRRLRRLLPSSKEGESKEGEPRARARERLEERTTLLNRIVTIPLYPAAGDAYYRYELVPLGAGSLGSAR